MLSFEKGIIRLFNENIICGAGFLVSENQAITCAHVVNAAAGRGLEEKSAPAETIEIDFPFSDDTRRFQATVTAWCAPQPDGKGDMAGLKIEGKKPENTISLPLYHLNELWDHRFVAYGFPENHAMGVLSTGRVLAAVKSGWYQIESNKLGGYIIERGFSGTPIWDEDLSGVIGMAVAADQNQAIRAGFIIPVPILVKNWPYLNPLAQAPIGQKLNLMLHKFILRVFSAPELLTFCIENYTTVAAGFTGSMSMASKVERLIDYCDRNRTIYDLLEKIKTRFPDAYRQFIEDFCSTSLGIKAQEDKVDFTPKQVVLEYKDVTSQAQMQLENPPGFNDFSFHDRDTYCEQIIESKMRFIELFGPGGVGKTYILKNLNTRSNKIFTIYLDLKGKTNADKDWVIQQAVGILEGRAVTHPAGLIDLVTAIIRVKREQRKSLFIFLFDSATEENLKLIDWLTGNEGLLNNNDFYEMLGMRSIQSPRELIKIVVASRQPLVKTNIATNCGVQRIPLYPLSRSLDTSRDLLKLMLDEIARTNELELLSEDANVIIDQILYLTRGHPKCAKLLLFAIANNHFLYRNAPWKEYFKNYVIPVIQTEMLASLNPDIIPVFWVLSVFRQFDQRLLGVLLSRKVIAGDPRMDDRLYAGQLREMLNKSNLVIEPQTGPTHAINPVVRRVLSLGMEYFQPERFRRVNSLALEIYTDWLFRSNLLGGERAVALFFELVYHSLKAMETDPAIQPEEICGKLVNVVRESYLPGFLRAIDAIEPDEIEANRASYLPLLKSNWDSDSEIHETSLRATGSDRCEMELKNTIYDFVQAKM